MQDWKTYKLGKITKWSSGGTPPKMHPEYWNGKIPWISAKSLKGRYVFDSDLKVTEAGLKKGSRLALKGSILLLVRGSGLYNDIPVAMAVIDVAYNQDVKCIEPKIADLLNNFLLYWFKGNKVTLSNMLEATSIGAGKFDMDRLFNLDVNLPSLQEQQAIASILSALDDKIELNLQINKTLEEMAMVLYKHWFVDFGPFQNGNFVETELGMIPEGWEVSLFSKFYDLKKGLSYKSKFYSKNGLPMINLKCFDKNGGFREDGIKYYSGDFKQSNVVKPGDLMIAMTDLTQDRAVLGSPIICPEIGSGANVIASLDIGILKQNNVFPENLNLYFNYKMRTKIYHEYILGYGNGSTVMHLDKKGVLEYNSIVPSPDVILEFNKIVGKYRGLMMTNVHEIKALTTLRDTLLPKLISGEIRVKDIEQMVAAAL